MKKVKNIIIVASLAVFFYQALIGLLFQIKHDYSIFKQFSGVSDEHKRALLTGSLYNLIQKSSLTIPEESHILLLTDNANEGLYLSYYLYPRRLFFNNSNPIGIAPPPLEELDYNWLNAKKIDWIIFRFSKKCNLNKIIKRKNGNLIEYTNFDHD